MACTVFCERTVPLAIQLYRMYIFGGLSIKTISLKTKLPANAVELRIRMAGIYLSQQQKASA